MTFEARSNSERRPFSVRSPVTKRTSTLSLLISLTAWLKISSWNSGPTWISETWTINKSNVTRIDQNTASVGLSVHTKPHSHSSFRSEIATRRRLPGRTPYRIASCRNRQLSCRTALLATCAPILPSPFDNVTHPRNNRVSVLSQCKFVNGGACSLNQAASPASDVASWSKSLSVLTPILPLEALILYSNSVSGF